MKMYNKRIGFIVSSQTLIPHGGIGQFAKSFCEMMELNGIKVDIITDKEPRDSKFVKTINANLITPSVSLPYTDHSNIFMYGDTFCYERMANFRNAIIKALENNIYDALICNTYESVQVCSTMGLEDVVQVIAYTHLESQIFKDTKNPFLTSTNEMMRKQLEINGLWIGTQSKFNELQFENAYHLPIPVTEKELLEEHNTPREGVLFIGRWEEGKNPELFIELIKQTNLPAKVMTSPNGVPKFEERLKKLGVPYEVKASIIGKEKVDFITSSRVAFNPSTVESYGMAFHEQMLQLPTFALSNQRWTNNFSENCFFKTDKHTMARDVLGAYNTFTDSKTWYASGILNTLKKQENTVFNKWMSCLNEFKGKQSNSNAAKICNEHTIKYGDYINKLNRRLVCIDDIRSVLTNKHKFKIIHTDENSYLTKDPEFVPESDSDDVFSNIFEVR